MSQQAARLTQSTCLQRCTLLQAAAPRGRAQTYYVVIKALSRRKRGGGGGVRLEVKHQR